MFNLFSFVKGVTGRVTTWLVVVVTASLLITSSLGYLKLFEVTEKNSMVRIDRAARAAAAIFSEHLSSEYTVMLDDDGHPLAIRLRQDTLDTSLVYRDQYDALLREIGLINQGAANLFRLNPETGAFDRFATTFRKPDGSMPPSMSIGAGHPAYTNLKANKTHLGEVPVMGRLRLAYLTPIQAADGTLAGALAVDVGWVDDLVVARTELQMQIIAAVGLILVLVATFGVVSMNRELKPLRVLAKYADDLAAEVPVGQVPYSSRHDEVGALSQGLQRVVSLQTKLAHLAYIDILTGLGNRSRYLEDLEIALRESILGKNRWSLIHLDADGFKQINDAYGQSVGDSLIKEFASRIEAVSGPGSKIARLNADEFTVLIDGDQSIDKVSAFAQNLVEAIREPLILPAGEFNLTASVGIILLQHDARDADEAHRNSTLAMRKAKADGGDQLAVFSSDMIDSFQDQLRLERMLTEAIANQEIEIHFQPQIVPSTNALAGVEALARWTHPVEGPISPGNFIPIAESSGQIVELGTLILDLACQQAAKWRKSGFDFKHISVNVSAIQLWQTNFIDTVKQSLKRYDLQGSDICIEITESVFVDNSERRIASVLAALRKLGVSLSLDDFGTGYSSLGYLNRLPFDQLKIDRSFVSDIDTDQRKQKVLRGVVELGRGLGFHIIVEGTETREEVMVVEEMGCDAVQGYYHARPAPALLIPGIVEKITSAATTVEAISA